MTFPFICVIAAYVVVYLAKLPVAMAMIQESEKGYDNRNPREQQSRLKGWGKRALAAHQNSFEVTPLFAAAVITAHLFNGDPSQSSLWAGVFVASRIVYIGLYLADIHFVRSLAWGVGVFACGALFWLAA